MRSMPRTLCLLTLLPTLALAGPGGSKSPGGAKSHAGHDHSGHDHAGHDHAGHDHGHDHGPERAALAALRKPLVGDWQVDIDATIDAIPDLVPIIARQGRETVARDLRRQVGEVRMSFLPDGGLLTAGADGIKHGLYAVQTDAKGLTVFAHDTTDNRLATSEYTARVVGDRLHLTHSGDTLVFRRGQTGQPTLDARLVGRWVVDLDRTMAADAKQRQMTAEQRKTTRDALAAFFGAIAFRFAADGSAETRIGGETHPATWRVLRREGNRLDVELLSPRGAERMQIDLDGQFARMVMTSQPNARPVVLRREK